ncbi:MAG: inosose dehydratase [Thermoleophilaceae bacterium]|jgi:inosose dehydratase|nr:inosose dehydratase [Thermoleophilaceae bacterium]
MQIRVANAPTSWGVEDPGDGANPRWPQMLDDLAGAGYDGTELGPLGYLPADPAVLGAELARRRLKLVGGFLFEPLHRRDSLPAVLAAARRTCRVLSAAGAEHLVIIQGFTADRERAAGRPGVAQPLPDADWAALIDAVHAVALLAAGDYGLTPVFHPHAGTHVEFEGEIDRLAADTDAGLVRLCIDTGHCAYAGFDPVGVFRRHADRVAYFHLKDVDRERLRGALARGLSFDEAVAERVFCPLGEGVVDFGALREALAEHGFEGWATVEQDRLPTDSGTPAEHAAASLAHLRRIGLACG